MEAYWGHFELTGSADLIRACLETLESFLEAEQRKLVEESKNLASRRQELRESIKAGEKADMDWEQLRYEQQNIDREDFILDQLSRKLRSSFFITLYAFFETQLRQRCLSKQPDDILLSIDEIVGRSITEKVKTYWEKVLGLQFPENSYWGDIHKGYRLLRNCIVHNDGVLDDAFTTGKRDLERFIRRRDNRNLLSLSGDEIVLHEGFCSKALDTIESFFHTLIDSCGGSEA